MGGRGFIELDRKNDHISRGPEDLASSTIDGLFAFAAVVVLLTSEFKYYLNVNQMLDSFPFIFHVAGYDEDGNNKILMAAAMNDHTIEQSTF